MSCPESCTARTRSLASGRGIDTICGRGKVAGRSQNQMSNNERCDDRRRGLQRVLLGTYRREVMPYFLDDFVERRISGFEVLDFSRGHGGLSSGCQHRTAVVSKAVDAVSSPITAMRFERRLNFCQGRVSLERQQSTHVYASRTLLLLLKVVSWTRK